MKMYKCLVHLGGSMLNQVRLEEVTAPEITLLRHLHGDDGVMEIEETGSVKRGDREERLRLANKYSPASSILLEQDGEAPPDGIALVKNVFGAPGVPLPKYVEDASEAEEDEEEEQPARRRGRPPKVAEPLVTPEQ